MSSTSRVIISLPWDKVNRTPIGLPPQQSDDGYCLLHEDDAGNPAGGFAGFVGVYPPKGTRCVVVLDISPSVLATMRLRVPDMKVMEALPIDPVLAEKDVVQPPSPLTKAQAETELTAVGVQAEYYALAGGKRLAATAIAPVANGKTAVDGGVPK